MRNAYTIGGAEEKIINRKIRKFILYYIEQPIRVSAVKLSIEFGYMEITGDPGGSNFCSLKIVQQNGRRKN